MELYSRQKHIYVELTGKDEIKAVSWLDDGIHEVRVILICRASTAEILSAKMEMLHYPWNICQEAAKFISQIEGMKIGPGIRKEIERKISRKNGCEHMMDLIHEAMRGIIQARFRLRYWMLNREQKIKQVQGDLKGTCFAYSNPQLNPQATGDWADRSLTPEEYEVFKRLTL